MVQETYAKALLVDRAALAAARQQCDVVTAEEVLKDAYQTDVRPILRNWREMKGLDPDPLVAFRRSGYTEQAAQQREHLHGPAQVGGAYQ